MTHRTRLQVEALEDRTTPSHFGSLAPAAFRGLDVAVVRFGPNPPPIVPPNPVRVAPVFALNYGDSVDGAAVPRGLNVALSRFAPTDPCRCLTVSPIFFGLADAPPPVVDSPT